LIRHAGIGSAPAILALTVPMIESSLATLLVAAVGEVPLLSIGLLPAQRVAVTLSPVAMAADPEPLATCHVPAKALTQNDFARDRHPRSQAGLDNGHYSWHGRTVW
jgi:hypothetical protein